LIIAPGPIQGTEGFERLSGLKDVKDFDLNQASSAMRRLGTIEDIGNMALYLCSPVAKYISGETIVVDGATSINRPPFIPKQIYQQFIRKPKTNSKL
jgi:enoyl-[acyl-carrier-protein] reductase (NADH)